MFYHCIILGPYYGEDMRIVIVLLLFLSMFVLAIIAVSPTIPIQFTSLRIYTCDT